MGGAEPPQTHGKPLLERDELVRQALDGKLQAIAGYDSILWKIRSGYLAILTSRFNDPEASASTARRRRRSTVYFEVPRLRSHRAGALACRSWIWSNRATRWRGSPLRR